MYRNEIFNILFININEKMVFFILSLKKLLLHSSNITIEQEMNLNKYFKIRKHLNRNASIQKTSRLKRKTSKSNFPNHFTHRPRLRPNRTITSHDTSPQTSKTIQNQKAAQPAKKTHNRRQWLTMRNSSGPRAKGKLTETLKALSGRIFRALSQFESFELTVWSFYGSTRWSSAAEPARLPNETEAESPRGRRARACSPKWRFWTRNCGSRAFLVRGFDGVGVRGGKMRPIIVVWLKSALGVVRLWMGSTDGG